MTLSLVRQIFENKYEKTKLKKEYSLTCGKLETKRWTACSTEICLSNAENVVIKKEYFFKVNCVLHRQKNEKKK